ncbi:MAG TPA: MBL fold metallo-hydrolase [Thermoplasmata archaeon]|nr:MBL fold metallo-hydrolase [Thermoplasmata archaeon]
MILEQLLTGFMANFVYLIGDEKTWKAAVVDPSYGAEEVLSLANEKGFKIELILVTHSHSDHVAELELLKKKTDAKVVAHRLARVEKDIAVEDGETLNLGNLDIKVLHTPGHTPDSVCYLIDGHLFTGDTLFVGECGRTDLPGGDSKALYHSLFDKIVKLSDETVILPGHHYGPRRISKLGVEKKTNYVLEKRSEEEFIKFMLEP